MIRLALSIPLVAAALVFQTAAGFILSVILGAAKLIAGPQWPTDDDA